MGHLHRRRRTRRSDHPAASVAAVPPAAGSRPDGRRESARADGDAEVSRPRTRSVHDRHLAVDQGSATARTDGPRALRLVPDARHRCGAVRAGASSLQHPALHLGPAEQTADFIATERWNQIFWRGFDWLLLMTVLFHGFLGVRTVLLDYHRPAAPVRVAGALRRSAGAVRHRHAGDPDAADPRRGLTNDGERAQPTIHDYPAVIVGAGGAGLWAALELARRASRRRS